MSWTPERIERLRQLWDEGFSTGEIAKAFGDVTRNAVSGAVFRLKLNEGAATVRLQKNAEWTVKRNGFVRQPANKPARQAPKSRAEPEARPGSRALKAPPVHRVNNPFGPAGKLKIAGHGTVFVEPEPRPARVVVPFRDEARGCCNVLTVGAYQCRWPLGDPLSPDFTFCGERAPDGPYCSAHRARSKAAVQPARKPRPYAARGG